MNPIMFLPQAISLGTSLYDMLQTRYGNNSTYNTQKNTNPYGYKDGGSIKIDGDPNFKDSVLMDYKGTKIKVSNGEVIDTNQDYVYSNNRRPGDGMLFSDVEDIYSKAINRIKNNTDNESLNAIKHMDKFRQQNQQLHEMYRTLIGENKPNAFADGGPINPNIQKVGNITFDSNKSRPSKDKSHMIVTDINTGKDYGVNRKEDGTYAFYENFENDVKQVKDYYKKHLPADSYRERVLEPNDISKNAGPWAKEFNDKFRRIQSDAVVNPMLDRFDSARITNIDDRKSNYHYILNRLNIDNKQLAENNMDNMDVLAHEFGHMKRMPAKPHGVPSSDQVPIGSYSRMRIDRDRSRIWTFNPEDDRFTSLYAVGNKEQVGDSHDASLEELASDLDAVRFHLNRYGVMKDPYKQINSEQEAKQIMDALRNNPNIKDQFTVKRALRLIKPDNKGGDGNFIKALNTISDASKEDNTIQKAANGGYIKRYADGGYIDYSLGTGSIKVPEAEFLKSIGMSSADYNYLKVYNPTQANEYLSKYVNANYDAEQFRAAQDRALSYDAQRYSPLEQVKYQTKQGPINFTEQPNLIAEKMKTMKPPTTDVYSSPKQSIWSKFGNMSGDDILLASKGAELALKTLSNVRKLPREKAYTDTTPIAMQQISTNPYLESSNTSYNAALDALDNKNYDRSMVANLYANKVRSDAQVINSVQNQNVGLYQQYLQNISNQERFNQQAVQDRDTRIAQNKGARDNRWDNIYTSIGNMGQTYAAYDSANNNNELFMKVMMQNYPDIAKQYIKGLGIN